MTMFSIRSTKKYEKGYQKRQKITNGSSLPIFLRQVASNFYIFGHNMCSGQFCIDSRRLLSFFNLVIEIHGFWVGSRHANFELPGYPEFLNQIWSCLDSNYWAWHEEQLLSSSHPSRTSAFLWASKTKNQKIEETQGFLILHFFRDCTTGSGRN